MNKNQWERKVKETHESFERWSVSASMNWEDHASQIRTADWAIPQCRDAFLLGDASDCFLGERGGTYMRFLWDNAFRLKQRGIYESALVCAYGCSTLGFVGWPNSHVASLFALADIGKLREAGDPIPGGDTFTICRGVAGLKKRQRTFPSLTGDYWTAAWYAVRFVHKNSTVFHAEVPREDILFYIDGPEKEFVVMCPPNPIALDVDWKKVGEEAKERHRIALSYGFGGQVAGLEPEDNKARKLSLYNRSST